MTPLPRMLERLRQTYRHVRVPPDDALLEDLPPNARQLVTRMSHPERRHALATYTRLRAAGADEELRLTGLLHDMGKPHGTRLWHRVVAVLLPGLATRVGSRTLRDYVRHAERGAEMARALGMGDRAVELIARHHRAPADEDGHALLRADRDA